MERGEGWFGVEGFCSPTGGGGLESRVVERSCTSTMFKVEILWKGNIISCMKSFGKRNCKLCMKERMAILNMWDNEPEKLINSRSEIFGGCRLQA